MTLSNRVSRVHSIADRKPALAFSVFFIVALAVGCTQQPERGSALGTSQPTPSPWALPTSTMRWNEYACDLIARNQVGQFPASRVLAYVNLSINNAIVLAQSGVPASLEGGKIYFGSPAEDASLKKRELVWIKRIPELWKKVMSNGA